MSLPNTITLAVDIANDGNPVNQDFGRYIERDNHTIYHGTDHSSVSQNLLGFYRTFPKPQGNSRGVERSSIKVTQDCVVLGSDGIANLTKPTIVKIDMNRPVGISDADFLAIRQRAAAALISEEAGSLTNGLVI